MYNNRINELREEIEQTHKRYTGERNDESATLTDVLSFFNISVDESRIEDYKISKIDYNVPSIEVVDTKDNTLFSARYTCDAELLNHFGGEVKFLEFSSKNDNRRVDKLFYIDDKKPIIEKLVFSDGDYDLVFEREMPNSVGFFIRSATRFTVRYLQNLEHNGSLVQQQLLTKVFSRKGSDELPTMVMEEEYTYGLNNYIEKGNSQDKYTYSLVDNVIYGIQELQQEGVCSCFSGICFEDAMVNIKRYLTITWDSLDLFFKVDDVKSLIGFKGWTDDGVHHKFSIAKTENKDDDGNGIYIKYDAFKWEEYKDEYDSLKFRRVTVADRMLKCPQLVDGPITCSEIENIVDLLNDELTDDAFIQIVISELKNFGNKIDARNKNVQEEFDPISPKNFINKSFDEIDSFVSLKKDDYFKLVRERFDALTKSSTIGDKVKVIEQKPQKNN